MTTTIIIADSLVNDFCSPLPEFVGGKTHVGLPEIERVMGRGEDHGRGPLPAFLRAARAAAARGEAVHTIFVRDLHDPHDAEQQPELLRFGLHCIRETPGADFVEAVSDLAAQAHVIDTPSLSVPADALHAGLRDILGKDVLALSAEERSRCRFVVAGFFTEVRVFSTAFKLRHDYRFPHVYTCPHLVGSRSRSAHVAALQVHLPNALVRVFPSLPDLAREVGLERDLAPGVGGEACRIEPPEEAAQLDDDAREIAEILFMFDSRVTLQPLKGGYSGSFLFLATPERHGVRQAPVVVKIAPHADIHRELAGFERVRELLRSHVAVMDVPVSAGASSGIRMTLAAKEGKPLPLQRLFEDASTPGQLDRFLSHLDRALSHLRTDLYDKTRVVRRRSPYQELALSDARQQHWLRENLGHILGEACLDESTLSIAPGLDLPNPVPRFPSLVGRVDYIPIEMATCHGDLNFANLITDDTGAVWIIDWPWCDERPLEIDFAKMESDLKLVLGFKEATDDDLPSLHRLEAFMLGTMRLPAMDDLPDPMAELLGHFHLEKVYRAVRRVREHYLALRPAAESDGLLYFMALLRYATHTLSFDARRNRGECTLPQLKHAAISTCLLVERLAASAFHRDGRRDRPPGYPERLAVPPDRISWDVPHPDYAPPVARGPEGEGGEPEDPAAIPDLRHRTSFAGPLRFSSDGLPLNPMGRVGLAGRGAFWKWGPNLAVDPVITRIHPATRDLEFALVRREPGGEWGLPGGFVRDGEEPVQAALRVALEKTGLDLDRPEEGPLARLFMDDYRNTDHAWAESEAWLFHLDVQGGGRRLRGGEAGGLEAEWLAVTPEFARSLFASHARIIAVAVRCLLEGKTGRHLSYARGRLEEFLRATTG